MLFFLNLFVLLSLSALLSMVCASDGKKTRKKIQRVSKTFSAPISTGCVNDEKTSTKKKAQSFEVEGKKVPARNNPDLLPVDGNKQSSVDPLATKKSTEQLHINKPSNNELTGRVDDMLKKEKLANQIRAMETLVEKRATEVLQSTDLIKAHMSIMKTFGQVALKYSENVKSMIHDLQAREFLKQQAEKTLNELNKEFEALKKDDDKEAKKEEHKKEEASQRSNRDTRVPPSTPKKIQTGTAKYLREVAKSECPRHHQYLKQYMMVWPPELDMGITKHDN